MRKSTFKKHIDQLSEVELRDELVQLYDKVEAVKNFYKLELGSSAEREKYYLKSKKDIASKFATKSYRRPRRPRIQKVNAIIRKLEKECIFEYEMIEIYLFTAETGIGFMKEYGFYSEVLYNNIINNFKKACEVSNSNHMWDQYAERFDKAIANTRLHPILKKNLMESYTQNKT